MLNPRRAYEYYKYNSPIPVMSEAETVLFNLFNLLVVFIGVYCISRTIPTTLIGQKTI